MNTITLLYGERTSEEDSDSRFSYGARTTDMEEETRQEETATIVGALSALDMQLQEVENTALERAQIFREEAEHSESPTSVHYNTGWYLLRQLRSDVQEIREYIDHLEEFVRTGTVTQAEFDGPPKQKNASRPNQTRIALRNAAVSFKKAANALHVVGRALETEGLDLYADHLYNLSESVEAEAKRARASLKSEHNRAAGSTGVLQLMEDAS